MATIKINIHSDDTIMYELWIPAPFRSGLRATARRIEIASLDVLHREVRYRMQTLDAARNTQGRAEIPRFGITRLRRDFGVYYELWLKDEVAMRLPIPPAAPIKPEPSP